MPRSPRHSKDQDDNEQLRYGRAWLALNTLLRRGKSFSGRERNRCFLNIRSGNFADISSASGLGYPDDGRAVAAVDWDFDGDLDIWTTNRTSPRIRFLSNNLPNHNHFVAFRLQGVTSNRDAIGARVEVYLGREGRHTRIKSLRAGDAFLSQSSKWIHFGLGRFDQINRVVVRWPGAAAETFRGLNVDQFWRIVQGSGQAKRSSRPHMATLGKASRKSDSDSGSVSKTTASTSPAGRIVLLNPVPLPSLRYHPLEEPDDLVSLHRGRPLLLGLWATWCAPCIAELTLWTAQYNRLTKDGLSVAALCVDQLVPKSRDGLETMRSVTERLRIPFDVGIPHENLVPFLDVTQRTFTFAQRPLPLPCSFLIDAKGRLAVVYKGSVSIDQVIEDSRLLESEPNTVLAGAIPYPGRWLEYPGPLSLRKLALALYESGQTDAAKTYIRRLIEVHDDSTKTDELAQLYRIQAAMYTDEKATTQAVVALQNVLRLAPDDRRAHVQLANLAISANDLAMAERHLTAALKGQPDNVSLLNAYANLRQRRGQSREAIELFRRSLALRDDPDVRFALANALIATRQIKDAVHHFEEALNLRPGWPPAANNLAWILATDSDSTIRDGEKAVILSQAACRATNHTVSEFLTTQAAALAEVGRFDEAVEVIHSAIAIAQKNENVRLVSKARAQLQRYRNRQPLRSD